jgi:hypothetical protein
VHTSQFALGLFVLEYWIGVKLHDPSPFQAALLVSVGFVAVSYGDTRYRIFWQDGEIKQISANKYVTTIRTSDITRVAQERSDLQTRLKLRRPADRISIYGGRGDEQKHIDVSLRHFVAADIRKLMQAVHDQRPDLPLPQNWV